MKNLPSALIHFWFIVLNKSYKQIQLIRLREIYPSYITGAYNICVYNIVELKIGKKGGGSFLELHLLRAEPISIITDQGEFKWLYTKQKESERDGAACCARRVLIGSSFPLREKNLVGCCWWYYQAVVYPAGLFYMLIYAPSLRKDEPKTLIFTLLYCFLIFHQLFSGYRCEHFHIKVHTVTKAMPIAIGLLSDEDDCPCCMAAGCSPITIKGKCLDAQQFFFK